MTKTTKILKMSRSTIDIDQVVVSRQDMKLLEVLAGRVREERREEEVWKESICLFFVVFFLFIQFL